MIQAIINNTKPKMQKVLVDLQEGLNNIRTGRANTSLVENIQVAYYGTQTPLKQMASLTTPDANSLSITPWDQNSLGDIENAIRASELGLNPVNDGHNIRLTLPPLTEERRDELVKIISKIAEEARVGLRMIRQETWEEIRKLEKEGKVTEDDRYRSEEELNKIIGDFNKKIEEINEKKEAELRTI